MLPRAPYLTGVRFVPERAGSRQTFPFNLPFLDELDLKIDSPVVFFVGENGSGKSTLLEAIADLSNLPVSGGSSNDLLNQGPESRSPLAAAIRPSFARRPRDGYFLRAELTAHFASLLDARAQDPDFRQSGNPYARYGGRSLHAQSHGESFLAILQNRTGDGLFLMDEPEAALSPQRQLTLLPLMWRLIHQKRAQFIVATHSPVLMTFPGATLFHFGETVRAVRLEETEHYQITKGMLVNPERYWKHLVGPEDE